MDAAPYLGKVVILRAYIPQGRRYKYEEVEYCGVLRHVLPAGQLPSQELKDLRGAGYTDRSRTSKYDRWTIQRVSEVLQRLNVNHFTIAMDPTWRVYLCDNQEFSER